MNKSVLAIILTLFWFSYVHAQQPTNRGQDYFTADKSPRSYLTILEGAHVATIPGWISKGRLDNAVLDIDYTLRAFPNHPQALQFAGLVSQLTKNPLWAIRCFENAVGAYPQNAFTHMQYGWHLITTGRIGDGIDRLKLSIQMDPTLSAGHAGLAHAYAKKGDLEQAQEAAKKARELGFTGKLPAEF